MATGTGKTYTTFQISWWSWKAKNVKCVLFLVDRNILADQTLINDFKPFGAVMTKIKNRKIDPAYEIHLGLYQAITGPDEEDKIFRCVSSPDASHQGFVVAGTGLFYDPERGGLNNEALRSLRELWSFLFQSIRSSELGECLKIKKP